MTPTYFAVVDTLYAQENGRCARRVTRAIEAPGRSGFEEVWEAVPPPDPALFAPPEAVPVADAPTRYGTTGWWHCSCPWRTHTPHETGCLTCGDRNPALHPPQAP